MNTKPQINNSIEKMIHNVIQGLRRFNSSLGKRALKEEVFEDLDEDFADLDETRNKINELIIKYQGCSFNDPNEARDFLIEMHLKTLEFESFFDNIHKTVLASWKQYDLLIKPLDPISTMEGKKQKELTLKCGNYILEVVGPYLVTYNSTSGISIFDHELNLIKDLHLVAGLAIDHVYKHASENKIIIYDQEHRRFILADLDKFTFNTITLVSINPNIFFTQLYQWEDKKIILISTKNKFFVCDTETGNIQKMTENAFSITYPELYGYWQFSYNRYGRTYYFIDKKEFAVDSKDEEPIYFMDYTDAHLGEIDRPNLDIHDITINDDKIGFVSEEAIQVVDKSRNTLLFLRPPTNHDFTRARLIKEKNKTILVTLSRNFAPLGSESKLIIHELGPS